MLINNEIDSHGHWFLDWSLLLMFDIADVDPDADVAIAIAIAQGVSVVIMLSLHLANSKHCYHQNKELEAERT